MEAARTPNGKALDLGKSVHDLCARYPELVEIMKELGFRDIASPGMLATAGRFVTIPKGAALKKIELSSIVNTLKENGFCIKGGPGDE